MEPIEFVPEDMESLDSEPDMPGDVDDRPLPVALPPIELPVEAPPDWMPPVALPVVDPTPELI